MTDGSLQRLARDRALITPELHESNDYYGHARILKRYAGISHRRSLKVTVEHGMNLSRSVWDVDLASPFGLFLCASQARVTAFEACAPADKRALAIGPMIRYLPPEDEPEPVSPRVLVIPAHSSHHVDASYDVAGFVSRALDPYAGNYDVRVCLYWKDVLRGAAAEYRREGLECVTAGHIYDPDFLLRFRRILRGASAVVTNSLGTHLFYAVLEGKPVWFVEQPVGWIAESTARLARDVPAEDAEITHTTATRLFAEPRAEPSAEQREFVEQVAGVNHLRSRAQLREVLETQERRYREAHPIRERALQKAWRVRRNTFHRLARAVPRARRATLLR